MAAKKKINEPTALALADKNRLYASLSQPITADYVITLLDQIDNMAAVRPTFDETDRALIKAAKDILVDARENLGRVKDPWVLELVHGAVVGSIIHMIMRLPGATPREVKEIREAAAAAMRRDDPKTRDAKMRGLLIARHYRNNPPTGVRADAPLEELLPTPGKMLRDGKLRRAMREYLPSQNIEDPVSGEWSGISETAMKRTRAEILGKVRPSRSKEALAKKPKLIKAAGMR